VIEKILRNPVSELMTDSYMPQERETGFLQVGLGEEKYSQKLGF